MKLKWNTNSKHVSIKNYRQIECNHSNSIQIKAKKSMKITFNCKNNCHIAHQLSILTTILATFQLRN